MIRSSYRFIFSHFYLNRLNGFKTPSLLDEEDLVEPHLVLSTKMNLW